MEVKQQRLVILESRRSLFHNYLNKNEITSANCVAGLFEANTDKGEEEFDTIERLLEAEANRNWNQLAEEITINFIKTNFCQK